MLQSVIIADDLTGANDTGAILAHNGFKVGTVLNPEHMEDFDEYNVLSMSTDSRAMTAEQAYEKVSWAAGHFPKSDALVYSKRIDSTLRGNVGAEIDAILDFLGESYTAVVVASFPSSGRTCIGDVLLVNGEPLQLTEVSRDPINPMRNSRVTDIVAEQTERRVGYIGLEQVVGNDLKLMETLKAACTACDIIVVDAQTDADIQAIAACCAASGEHIVAIDPGPFTAALADYTFNRSKYETEQSILCVVGSASELTRKQLQYLREKDNPFETKLDVTRLFDPVAREDEVSSRVAELVEAVADYQIVVVKTVDDSADLIDFSEVGGAEGLDKRECSRVITGALAELARRVVDAAGRRLGGIYATGGDVAVAVVEALGTTGFDVRSEVIPLAIYSRLIGGERPDMPVVTKGGLVGTNNTLFKCVSYLKGIID